MGVGLKMSDQAENLAKALKGDKKTTGNWGEVQLERTLQLAGLERGTHYEAQAAFRDGEGRLRVPDFVIKLPDGKHLVIDSKVSLVDYDRAMAAESEEERAEALKAHTLALKRHIDDLAGKDYASLGGYEQPGAGVHVHADRSRLHRGAQVQPRAVQRRLPQERGDGVAHNAAAHAAHRGQPVDRLSYTSRLATTGRCPR
jgi:hypothetical protein